MIVVSAIANTQLSGCKMHAKRVLVIGDSISYMSAGDISRVGNNVTDTDPFNRVTFSLIVTPGIGARRTWGKPAEPDEYWSGLIAHSIQSDNFDAIIVELGTNDCSLIGASGDYQPDIERIVGAISKADPHVPIFG